MGHQDVHSVQHHRRAGLRLLSVSPAARNALDFVSAQLRLPAAIVADLMQRAPCVLPVQAEADDLSRIRAMLLSVGLRVECLDDASDAISLTLLADDPDSLEDLALAVARALHRDQLTVRTALAHPCGLTVVPEGAEPVAALLRRLRRIPQLTVVQAVPADATYDVFAGRHLPSGLPAHLRFLGILEDPVTQAIGAALDHRLVQHIRRRYPSACILDRAVQRFDLWLVQPMDWTADDLADFLMVRTGLPRGRFDTVSRDNPIRLETSLPRQSALRFRADYAAIGLKTCLCLSQAKAGN